MIGCTLYSRSGDQYRQFQSAALADQVVSLNAGSYRYLGKVSVGRLCEAYPGFATITVTGMRRGGVVMV